VGQASGGDRPSYDELAAVVVGLTARLDELAGRIGEAEADNARLVAENVGLRDENAELRRRWGLDSKNSAKAAVVGRVGQAAADIDAYPQRAQGRQAAGIGGYGAEAGGRGG
jgi:regulator of replication initiation timing